eukprot:scaffold5843_cov125-Isochrysis_galbana.AAC.1
MARCEKTRRKCCLRRQRVELSIEPPRRFVVDSRSCGSKRGCCSTHKSVCNTLFPCQERRALAIGPGQCQECQPVRRAMPGSAAGARAGAQSHLRRALVGAGRPDSLRARLRVVVVLNRLREELSGRHRAFNRVRGIFPYVEHKAQPPPTAVQT